MKLSNDEDDGWDRGWEEHRIRQLRRMAKLPFSQKLEWLEAAEALANQLISAREKQLHDQFGRQSGS